MRVVGSMSETKYKDVNPGLQVLQFPTELDPNKNSAGWRLVGEEHFARGAAKDQIIGNKFYVKHITIRFDIAPIILDANIAAAAFRSLKFRLVVYSAAKGGWEDPWPEAVNSYGMLDILDREVFKVYYDKMWQSDLPFSVINDSPPSKFFGVHRINVPINRTFSKQSLDDILNERVFCRVLAYDLWYNSENIGAVELSCLFNSRIYFKDI